MVKAKENDIVQIIKGDWVGALVHVIELYNWGIQGFVHIPNKGRAFVRIKHEEYVVIGESYFKIN